MAHSVTYQKFTVAESDEDKPKAKRSSRSLIAGIVLVSVALVALALVIGVGAGIFIGRKTKHRGLKMTAISKDDFEGEYNGQSGGIDFDITTNLSYVNISVATTVGDPVINLLYSANLSMAMIEVQKTNFLVMVDHPRYPQYASYVIPDNYTDAVYSIMMGEKELSDEIIKMLDNETVDDARQLALERLAMSQVGTLIVEASDAVADEEIIGGDYPAVMRFYLLALNLASTRETVESNGTMATNLPRVRRYNPVKPVIDAVVGLTCTDDDIRLSDRSSCDAGKIPYENDACLGMCGPGCCCWRRLCGTCCIHEYCRTHDNCCEDYTAWKCWKAVFDIFTRDCESPFNC